MGGRTAWSRVFLAMVVLAAGCGSHKDPEDAQGRGRPATASPNEPIQALLRERSNRLMAGDVDGYLAALGPEARSFEAPIARVALTLPLASLNMTINEATISDDGARFRGASVWLTYTFKELPADNPFRVRFLYDIDRQKDGRWMVTKSKFDDRGVPPPPPLWPYGPVEFTRSEHFLVMASPGVPRIAEAIAVAEKAYQQLLPGLPVEPNPRALLALAKDAKQFEDNYGPRGDVALTRVFCNGGEGSPLCRPEERLVMADLPGTLDATLVKGENAGRSDAVFRHQLAHLALARFTRSCTNWWVDEGGAMFLAGERRTDEWKLGVASAALDQLRLNPPDPHQRSYGLANAAVLYLVEAFGSAKFFDFYQNFKNLYVPGTDCSGEVRDVRSVLDERLLRRYYRFGVEDLEGLARDYIRKAVASR